MFKPFLFAALYIVLGVVGWQAYSAIENSDISVSAMKPVAAPLPPPPRQIEIQQPETMSKAVHRWKDQNGNWQYGELPANGSKMEKYEKELALLRKLPREALPTQAILPENKNESLLDKLPSWSDIRHLITEDSLTQRATESLEDAKNVEKVVKQREKNLSEMINDL